MLTAFETSYWRVKRCQNNKGLDSQHPVKKDGGGKGIRTPGLFIANEALYQLSYTPTVFLAAADRISQMAAGSGNFVEKVRLGKQKERENEVLATGSQGYFGLWFLTKARGTSVSGAGTVSFSTVNRMNWIEARCGNPVAAWEWG